MPFTKQHSACAWVVTCILFLINLTFHNLSLHSSYTIHQPFTDYFLRLPYSEQLEKSLFRSRANRRLVFQGAAQAGGLRIPDRCRGRAQRLKPLKRTLATPVSKPSREGEVRMANSMAGAATRIWFRQLRRLQSLKHAVAAAKDTPAAVSYRIELWEAIKRSTGFSPNFCTWWSQQGHEVDGVPQVLPTQVPHESVVTMAMYDSFLLHFRRFEKWHLNQRSQSLKMKYVGSMKALYHDLRDDSRPGITTFWKDERYTILAVEQQGQQIHLGKNVHSF